MESHGKWVWGDGLPWKTGNCFLVLPISVQNFDLSSVLPAVFHALRHGRRRGRGRFEATFGSASDLSASPQKSPSGVPTVRVADAMMRGGHVTGFDEATASILADILLCFCLGAKYRQGDTDAPVTRVYPTHVFSSWADLPRDEGHLRLVPEFVTVLLADQEHGPVVVPDDKAFIDPFPVGNGHACNVLLRVFSRGVTSREGDGQDEFDEGCDEVGLDQLLTIRIAQMVGEEPVSGGPIPNRRSAASRACEEFSSDLRRFIEGYAEVIPRQAFVDFLEAALAVGLTKTLTSTVDAMSRWEETGSIPEADSQRPFPLLADCSSGIDTQLALLAKGSFAEFDRQVRRFPVTLMQVRLLSHFAISRLKWLPPQEPSAIGWLDRLGSLRRKIKGDLRGMWQEYAGEIARSCAKDGGEPLGEDFPGRVARDPDPVAAAAEVLTARQPTIDRQLGDLVSSVLHAGHPNGLALKPQAQRKVPRMIVLTDPVLDYLVHQHTLPKPGEPQASRSSFVGFLRMLREHHGIHVDESPPGVPASASLLQENRSTLERRLRDLGLLEGVNDAESMKTVRPRFHARQPDGTEAY